MVGLKLNQCRLSSQTGMVVQIAVSPMAVWFYINTLNIHAKIDTRNYSYARNVDIFLEVTTLKQKAYNKGTFFGNTTIKPTLPMLAA